MKKMLLFFSIVLMSSKIFAGNSYTLDEPQIDDLFNQAIEISLIEIAEINSDFNSNSVLTIQDDIDTKVLIACIVSLTGLSGFGIHRYVLGTKPEMWAVYTFTICGIFGIVPVVDFWVLLIDGLVNHRGEKYTDNENFLMWAS